MKYIHHPRCCKSFIIYDFKGDYDSDYLGEDSVDEIKNELKELIYNNIEYEEINEDTSEYQIIITLNDLQPNAIKAVKKLGFKLVNTLTNLDYDKYDKKVEREVYTFIIGIVSGG